MPSLVPVRRVAELGSLGRFGNCGFTMSKTLFVNFRDGGFWAFDVVSAVFLKHLIDAANIHLERHDEPCLADAVAHWRFNAVCGDCGLFLDDSWSVERTGRLRHAEQSAITGGWRAR